MKAGTARAITKVPTTQSKPARDDREAQARQRGDEAGLDVAERGRRRDLRELDPGDAAPERVGRHRPEDRAAEDRADVVRGPGGREQQQGEPERLGEAEGGDRDAPERGRDRDVRALAGARGRSSPRAARRRARRRTAPRTSGPRTPAPPLKRFSASAGKSARGIPKTIAFESTRNMPSSTFLLRTKRKPSAIVRRLGRSASCAGGSAGSRQTDQSEAENVAASSRYAPFSPSSGDQQRRRAPGPATLVVLP